MTVDDLKALLHDAPGHYQVGVTDGDGVMLWPGEEGVIVILKPEPAP